nr:MAG TPA: formylglycinamide ribonucleotide amidotransferase [Caudoviricetes sp.]
MKDTLHDRMTHIYALIAKSMILCVIICLY